MIEIRSGSTSKPASSERLVNAFEDPNIEFDGVLYIGYPVFFVAGESVSIDALLVSRNKGVVIFDLVEGADLSNREENRDELYSKMKSQLVAVPELNKKRDFAVNINVATFAPAYSGQICQEETFSKSSQLVDYVNCLQTWGEPELYDVLLAQVQSTLKLRSSKNRSYVEKHNSKGAIVKDFEATIANLDSQQEKAVIEAVNGIQRIRGLAGSGKTVILALKAAYFHAKNPQWKIVVTFHTRSLKQQFRSLITRFCIEKIGQEPNWANISILNAWGSPSNPGVYSEICRSSGAQYHTYGDVKNKIDPFGYVNIKLLNGFEKIDEQYDVILIDEAQDLPISFLQVCFKALKKPKRLVYAYDEMQKLNQGESLPAPLDIFGYEAQDIILRCCYRNPRPLLVSAHAAGFGIYRENMVQFFNKPDLWYDVGYQVRQGKLEAGSEVILHRPKDTSPGFYEERVNYDDLIGVHRFDDIDDQADWIVAQITKNIEEEELLPSDILVINPDAFSTKSATNKIRLELVKRNIRSHITGEMNADVFTREDSVAFSGIYRAKGNEASMVYLINADECYESEDHSPSNLIRKRNTLFTAITRSKAWVNICGVGSRMEGLKRELTSVSDNNYELRFIYPTDEEIDRMNVIHRDVSGEQKRTIDRSQGLLSELMKVKESIDRGDTYLEDYPEEIVNILKSLE